MKRVEELSKNELDELRFTLYWELVNGEGILDIDDLKDIADEIDDVDDITDDILFEHYCSISFVDDDFFCNQEE